MRIALYILVALVLIIVVVFGVGAMLPVGHTASVRARIPAPADSVWAALDDVRGATGWRSGLDSVEVLSDEPLRWRETTSFGAIAFERDAAEPPHRMVNRITEADGFGGRWTFLVDPETDGSLVTITEDGEVHSALFRFMSRFVFGHYGNMETYLRDLGRRFGAEVEPERVE